MRWRPHTDAAAHGDLAAIVVPRPMDGAPLLLPELYRFDAPDGLWYSARTALPLRHVAYRWLPESDLLTTLR